MLEAGDFNSFGPSFLADQTRGELQWCELPREREDARRQVRHTCPDSPGVYGWLNSERQLIYVGKAKALRNRVLGYLAKTPADPKMARIRAGSATLVWEPIADELLALLREQELIHRWRPEFNSQGQPTRRQPAFICISDSAAPHAFLAKRLANSGYQQAFGPIAGTQRLSDSVQALNYVFGLRDCADKTKFEFGDQLRLFDEENRAGCLRFELGSCPGPCAALCTRPLYLERVSHAVRFLTEGSEAFLQGLEARMTRAAEHRHYERAAMLRDQLDSLTRLERQLKRLRVAERTINGVLAVTVNRGRQVWLAFRKARLISSIVQPRSYQQAERAMTELQRVEREAIPPAREILEINLQLIIAAWFRKHPSRLADLRPFSSMQQECLQRQQRYRLQSQA
jgi:excinuclease ABC subunit C